ncbi:interleukin-11 receptor subunit alpha [Gouania willdenowi]|uniref:Interleukin-11 receptor subunit alpha-1-like n=1 Tax=Gouania willdenowi TaxID=441366 RepID=A0A8C5FZU3_GOUWI|nr:interleukin-11 receptor subunit alpha-1-like [Gouania willdenowi]
MPGLLSSAVCLTLIWFLSQSLCPDGAQIWTDEVSGMQYGRLDSNVTLSCGNSQFRLPVFWRLNNNSLLPWHEVAPDGRLILLHANQSAQGNYSCHDTTGLLVHSVTLRLGRPPGLLDIACQMPNHTFMRCLWSDRVKTLLPAKYNASLHAGLSSMPCTLDITHRHCEVHQPPLWIAVKIKITETNVLGNETSIAHLNMLNLLKPDPPEAVMVKPLQSFPQRLGVSWKFPSSWRQRKGFPLLFQIRYRPEDSEYWSQLNATNSSAVIMDALAGHIHQVEVRARDEVNSDSQWSEWSPVVLAKPWEVFTTPDTTLRPEDAFTDYSFPFPTKPETVTAKSHNPGQEEEGNVGLVIILVIFSVLILTAIFSLVFVWWLRQKRRDKATKQVLTSMVRMKSMPI